MNVRAPGQEELSRVLQQLPQGQQRAMDGLGAGHVAGADVPVHRSAHTRTHVHGQRRGEPWMASALGALLVQSPMCATACID